MKNTNLLIQIDNISDKLEDVKELIDQKLYEDIIHVFYILESIYFGVQDTYAALTYVDTLEPDVKRVAIKSARNTLSRLMDTIEDGEVHHFNTNKDRNETLEQYRAIMKKIKF